ncbi:uncharacterized protein LOC143014259 isoform X3 [Genypterus blacodes]|uniref:uncharacterized protein LOC143014259 isoform X3 n=1 Tax=Genypterus blacodes TaxID=154954 RepID=UPI003F768FA1
MDPLDFIEPVELLRFFACNKTEISCLDKPQTLLRVLRDHNLIPEDRYKKVIRMKSKENIKQALYGVLDWLETERSQYMKLFWTCVFKESIMNVYPTLKILRNSLMDGTFQFSTALPEKVEKVETTNNKKRKQPSEDGEEEEEQTNTERKKKKRIIKRVCSEEEQAGPSAQLPRKLRSHSLKGTFSPLKRGEKGEFWTWAIYKSQLPVTCGKQEGFLKRDKLAKGEFKCIVVKKQWFTPPEFEKFAGKGSNKNWKKSILCLSTPLGKLIQGGHLECKSHVRKAKAKKSLFPSKALSKATDEDEEADTPSSGADEDEEADTSSSGADEDEEPDTSSSGAAADKDEEADTSSSGAGAGDDHEEQQADKEPGCSHGNSLVFKVTCGPEVGTLHKTRFASGTCGKSIRTETSWVTPEEFVKKSLPQPDASWRKDIQWEGKPLCELTQANVLSLHSLVCKCSLCRPDCDDLESQKNDDECCVCRRAGVELVMCDDCPLSFHQTCHLPDVPQNILGDGRPWICTFCVFRRNQKWQDSEELSPVLALSRPISASMMQCQYLLLFLYVADEEQIFTSDPRLYVEGYTNAVRTPMWLDKVAEKLQEKTYQTVRELVSDIQLIFTNCASFNRDNEEFHTKGARLKELFEREFKNVFSISEETDD